MPRIIRPSMKPYAVYDYEGRMVRAGRNVYTLVDAYNKASNPRLMMTSREHQRADAYVRAILNRLQRERYIAGAHFGEYNSGRLYVIE